MSRRDHIVTTLVAVMVVAAVAPTVVGQSQPAGGDGQKEGTVVGRPDLDVSAATSEFDAGSRATLRLVVSNAGRLSRGGPARFEERVQTARGLRLEVDGGSTPIDVVDGTAIVGNVPAGAARPAEMPITIPEGTEPGRYRLSVEVAYTFTAGVEYGPTEPEYNDFDRTERLDVTIRVTDDARFEVVDVDSGAQIGDRGTVSVTVANVGTERARDATVRLSSTSDELVLGRRSQSSTAFVPSWEPGERQVLNYTVSVGSDATRRQYVLEATVAYEDTQGIDARSAALAFGIEPAREQRFALRRVTSNLRSGRTGEFAATVVNRGPERVRKPVVTLRATDPAVTVETAEAAVPSLDPGERARVTFDVAVSDAAGEGRRQLNVSVRYRNQLGDLRLSDPLERQVRVRPERDRFEIEPVDATVGAGSRRSLELRVTNAGDETLRDVELKLFTEDPLSSDDDEAFVSSLAPGETATLVVGVEAGSAALAKTYQLSVDLQYDLPDGDTELSRTYSVPVTVEGRSGGNGVPLVPIGVVAVVAGAAGVVWYRRRG